MKQTLRYLINSLMILLVVSCGGGGGGGTVITKITSFTASAITINEGSSVTLTAVFENGTASINNGVGAVSSNVAKPVTPTTTTTYILTVTNSIGDSITSSVMVTVLPAYNIFPPGFFEIGYSHNKSFTGSDTFNDFTATLDEVTAVSPPALTGYGGLEGTVINESLKINGVGLPSFQYYSNDLNDLKFVGYEILGDSSFAFATSTTVMPLKAYIGDSGTMGSYERSDGSTFTITWELVADTDIDGNAKYITTTISRDSSVNKNLVYTATVTNSINQAGTISKQIFVIVYHEGPDRTLTLTSL